MPEGTLVIGEGIHVTGDIASCDTLVVKGAVRSAFEARRLEIHPGGRVEGEARVKEAHIDGVLEGKLMVSETLSLGRHGRVKASLRYGRLQVERGGQISGEIGVWPVELTVAAGPER